MSDIIKKYHLSDVPYKSRGRDLEGLDCYGLHMFIVREICGLAVPDFTYGEDIEKSLVHLLIQGGKSLVEEIERPAPWCIVTFVIRPPYESHIGTVLDNCREFIHIGSMVPYPRITRLSDIRWHRHIGGFYQWKL